MENFIFFAVPIVARASKRELGEREKFLFFFSVSDEN